MAPEDGRDREKPPGLFTVYANRILSIRIVKVSGHSDAVHILCLLFLGHVITLQFSVLTEIISPSTL